MLTRIVRLLILISLSFAASAHANCVIHNEIPRMGSLSVQYGIYAAQRTDRVSLLVSDFEECKKEALLRARLLISEGRYFREGKAVFSRKKERQVYKYTPLSMVEGLLRRVPEIPNQQYTLKNCEVAELHDHAVKNDGTHLVSECTPDTLYVWASLEKLKSAIDEFKTNSTVDGAYDKLIGNAEPISRYAFGSVLMRIKLKPQVRIAFVRDYESDPCTDQAGIVATYQVLGYVEDDDSASVVEYHVCSPRDIESISYGLTEIQTEALRDFQWVRSHYPDQYDLWFKYSKLRGNNNIDSLYFNNQFERLVWEKDLMLDRILTIGIMAENGHGEAVTRPNETRLIERHFETALPTYFHP